MGQTGLANKSTRWLLLALILLAFGLRVHRLDAFSFWLDEGLTPLRSGYPVAEILTNEITIQEGQTKDTHPPFFYLLIHFSRMLLGESDWAYRYPSVLAGIFLIPLLYQLARRLDNSRIALFVALLAAINPLQVWYAQEARMYTLLTLLGAVLSVILWQALNGRQLVRWMALYLPVACLAFYTHYTAIFLIAGQVLLWIWLLWRKKQYKLLFGGLIAGVLLISPLIPYIITRALTGIEANYFYVSPLIMLQDMVHGFGLGRSVDFKLAGVKLLDVAAGILLVLGLVGPARDGKRGWLPRLFLACCLMAPVIGLMLGSLIKPMYMGVRHIMLASPAFLLLLGRGVGFLNQKKAAFLRPLAWIGAAVLVAGPVYSLQNLYTNPHYAKDDVRALIQYFELNAGDRDVLVFNDSILLPLYWHYSQRQDLTATALPVYPYPALEETKGQLRALAERYDRIWFLDSPPGDGRDSGHLVSRWLENHLLMVEKISAHGSNLIARLEVYDTASPLPEGAPDSAQPLSIQWKGMPELKAVLLGFDQPVALPSLWFNLYWQGAEIPDKDVWLRFVLRGPDGKTWLDNSQSFWPGEARDSITWPDDGMVALSYHLPVLPGLPPGRYDLLAVAWNEAGGQQLGDWQLLSTVDLGSVSDWPLAPEWPFKSSQAVRFANGMELAGISPSTAYVKPGHILPLTLFWRSQIQPAGLQYRIELVNPSGDVIKTKSGKPGASWLYSEGWPTDAIIRQEIGINFPAEARVGTYQLRLGLVQDDAPVSGRPAWRPWYGEQVTIGRVEVEAWPMETELPEVGHPVKANVGTDIELYGYDLDPSPQPGGVWNITLVWQAKQVPAGDVNVFVHLVSANDGTIAAQLDRIPVDWLRPTTGWRKGEVLVDVYALPIPQDLPPGDYSLMVGMYDPETWQRLPVVMDGQVLAGDQLELAELAVP